MKDESPVVLVRVQGRSRAELVCSYLRANGIECVISQEAAAWLHGFEIGPVAEVDILIPPSQEVEARELYQQFIEGQAEA